MADGSLKPNEALLPGLGVVQAKSFAVPFPAPVAPKAPCLTCAKEPVVTIPKTEPVHPPTSPATSPQPIPPVVPTPSAPTLPTSSFLDQELRKLRQGLLQKITSPSVPVVAPSIQPMPSTRPRPIITPAPALAAPRELLWSQLGVGYVGMQPFARPMVNGGLSGMMTGFRETGRLLREYLQLRPDWFTMAMDGEVKGCPLTIRVIGWGEKAGASEKSPSASINGDDLTVEYRFAGSIDKVCHGGVVVVTAEVSGVFEETGNHSHERRSLATGKNQGSSHGVFRVRAEAYTGPDIVNSPDDGTIVISRKAVKQQIDRLERSGDYKFDGPDSLRIEVYAKIEDECSCVADDQFRCKFPDVLSAPADAIRDYPDLGAPDFQTGLEPCRLSLECNNGGVLAKRPAVDKQGHAQGDDVLGFIAVEVTADPNCNPTTVEVQMAGDDASSMIYEFRDGVGQEDKIVRASPSRTSVEDSTATGVLAAELRVDIQDAQDAIDRNATQEKDIDHAWKTIGFRIVVTASDNCGCKVTKTFVVTRKQA